MKRPPKVKHGELSNVDMTRCDGINAAIWIIGLMWVLWVALHH
jgi:hypothetical protein